jgi:hypothetical protein
MNLSNLLKHLEHIAVQLSRVAKDMRSLNRVTRATAELEKGNFDYCDGFLKIKSDSGNTYLVTKKHCSCKAGSFGKYCWHKQALMLIDLCAEMCEDEPAQEPNIPEYMFYNFELGTRLTQTLLPSII